VYLLEPPFADFIFISREHFLIDYDGQSLTLVDRGSVCGTIVQGKQIGGNRSGGRTVLQDGDEIIIGTTASPYRFRFDVVATP
jgi:pSer/pThr/pTyr-binding forkhead associated (FHA) protein